MIISKIIYRINIYNCRTNKAQSIVTIHQYLTNNYQYRPIFNKKWLMVGFRLCSEKKYSSYILLKKMSFMFEMLSLKLKFPFKLESSERGWKCEQLFNCIENFSNVRFQSLQIFSNGFFELESFAQFRISQKFSKISDLRIFCWE